MREAAGLSQTVAASVLGMSMRAYQSLEAPDGNPRPIHVQAFERGLMDLAIQRGDASGLPPATLAAVLGIAAIVGETRPADVPDPALAILESRRAALLADLAPVEAALDAYRKAAPRRRPVPKG